MSFEIHREPLYKKYRAPYYSAACLYAIVFGFLLIFVPFMIAYNSRDFWIKEKVVYEQPDVIYRYNAMFQLFGDQPDKPLSLFYSSSNKVNTLFQERVRMSVLKSSSVDTNDDGMMDRLELGLQMPLHSYENVTRVSGVVYHTVTLKDRAKYMFDSISYFNYESGSPLGAVTIDGDVLLRQTHALHTRSGFKKPYDHDVLIDLAEDLSSQDMSFGNLLQRVGGRNITTTFVPTYSYAAPAMHATGRDAEFPKMFNATVTMRVPLQPVLIQLPVSEVLKWGWVQFASFLVVVGFLLNRLTSFIFGHRLIYADCRVDVVHEKFE